MPLNKDSKKQTITSWIETQNSWRSESLIKNREKLKSFRIGHYTIKEIKSFFAPLSNKYYGLLEEYVEATADGIPEINIKLIRFDEKELGTEYGYSQYHKTINSSSFKLPRLIKKYE